MKRSQFNYFCPPELIAQEPAQKREDSRLLVYNPRAQEQISDHHFFEVLEVLNNVFTLKEKNKKLLLIGNNSKVYPARLKVYKKTGAKCEVFILEVEERESYSCLIKPRSKLKEGETLYLDTQAKTPVFQIIDFENSKVKPLFTESMVEFLEKHGTTPLPPYIKRDSNTQPETQTADKTRYQNVYAENKRVGSAAAPTAGFHFSKSILNQMGNYNIQMDYITLHVGLGTFLPVKTENIEEHTMHQEIYRMNISTVQKIYEYTEKNWPIVFVGTTALRSVESFFRNIISKTQNSKPTSKENYDAALSVAEQWVSTNLFLYPKNESDYHKPLIGDAIITNFHQPESSLLMLIASIVGYHNLNKIYSHAVQNKYRFFSYGDSSLLIF